MIRSAVFNDVKSINDLGTFFNSNFEKTYSIKDYLQNEKYLIFVNEDNYVNAFMIVYKNLDFYELELIVVAPESRGNGIASNLINYFIKYYTKSNDVVLLEVAENNKIAINLYRKFNFEIINTRKKYYKTTDAYIMKKVVL